MFTAHSSFEPLVLLPNYAANAEGPPLPDQAQVTRLTVNVFLAAITGAVLHCLAFAFGAVFALRRTRLFSLLEARNLNAQPKHSLRFFQLNEVRRDSPSL